MPYFQLIQSELLTNFLFQSHLRTFQPPSAVLPKWKFLDFGSTLSIGPLFGMIVTCSVHAIVGASAVPAGASVQVSFASKLFADSHQGASRLSRPPYAPLKMLLHSFVLLPDA